MKNLSWWRKILGAGRCVLCHDSVVSDGLCVHCATDLSALFTDAANVCPRCAQYSAGGSVCGCCQRKLPPFEQLWASVYYEPPVSGMIHEFKHRRDLSMLPSLVSLMKRHPPPWLKNTMFDAVLAMPLSRERRLFRGFNQSDELARLIARNYSLPLLPHSTVFRRPTLPQSTLNGEERRKNVRRVFEVRGEVVKDCKLLLIDDVVTTGATLDELSRTLKRVGAGQIFCWTLARSQMKKF